MKLKSLIITGIAVLSLSVSAFAAEKLSVVVNDGSAMESGDYVAFTITNVTEKQKNEYGMDFFDVDTPSEIEQLPSEEDAMFYVLKYEDYEKYFLSSYDVEAMEAACLLDANGKATITEGGKYGVCYMNGAYEYSYVITATETAPAPAKPEKAETPAAPVVLEKVANAVPTNSKVVVNGASVAFDAYNINGNNYFKLRDVAKVVLGSEKQFAVTWDGEKSSINLVSGQPYETVGGELAKGDGKTKTATLNTSKIYKDGAEVALGAYTINGNNYFKLRDLGKEFNFGIGWDGANNCITINTAADYTE